ncbi:MAG: DUF6427 family protein [Bacteroidales bacterium]|nr:DUF6427 family protein [Bacteroidales bacterium]
MFLRMIKSNQPIVLFLIILLAISLWGLSFLNPIAMSIPYDKVDIPINSIISRLAPINSGLSVGLGFSFTMLIAFLLIQFNKHFIVINHRTYLPAFFYILLVSAFVPLQRFNSVLLGMLFMYSAVSQIYGMYRNDTPVVLSKIYLAGFFITLASFCWVPFIVYFLLVPISLVVLRPFVGREWLAGLLGGLTPLLFIWTYYYVFNYDQLIDILSNVLTSLEVTISFNKLHFVYYLFYGFVFLIMVIASFVEISNYQTKKIRIRKFFAINWWVFFIGSLLFIFFKNVKYEIIYVLAMPLAFLLSDYFYMIRKPKLLNIILFKLLVLVIFIQIIAHYY